MSLPGGCCSLPGMPSHRRSMEERLERELRLRVERRELSSLPAAPVELGLPLPRRVNGFTPRGESPRAFRR